MNLRFVGGAYGGRSDDVNSQLCVNAFVEIDQTDTSRKYLVGSPGLELFVDVGDGPIRAIHKFDGLLWVVSKNVLYSVTDEGTATLRGYLNSESGPVQMEDNGAGVGDQLMVVDGNNGYIWDNLAATFVVHPSALFYGADTLTYQDGFLIFNRPGTDEFGISVSDDASLVTSYQAAEGNPDKLLAVFSDHRQLWLFGEISSEVWYYSGDADFPFDRFQGGYTERGISAAQTVARVGNTVMWLAASRRGNSEIVVAADGYRSSNITPPQISYAIDNMSRIDDAFAFSYVTEGHEFYQITFPTADVTYVFDAATKEWHQRSSSRDSGLIKRHLANCHVIFDSSHMVGSYVDGKIYRMKSDVYDENGDEIIRERIGPHVRAEHLPLRLSEVEMLLESGTGLASGDESNPQVGLRWSKDGGHTWGSWLYRDVGKQGQYNKRQIWRKLGSGRDWLFHLRHSNKTKFILHDSIATVKDFTNRGRGQQVKRQERE